MVLSHTRDLNHGKGLISRDRSHRVIYKFDEGKRDEWISLPLGPSCERWSCATDYRRTELVPALRADLIFLWPASCPRLPLRLSETRSDNHLLPLQRHGQKRTVTLMWIKREGSRAESWFRQAAGSELKPNVIDLTMDRSDFTGQQGGRGCRETRKELWYHRCTG